MDYSLIINAVLKLWWLAPILFIILIANTPWFKGMFGEALVKLAGILRLPANTYHRIHNVTLLTADGSTQIDHIFISRYGIFVVETKNMKGWIFGSENQAQWTQKIYKKSFRFQNPLRQNYKHVKAVEAALNVPPESIHSLIVFTGASTFKTAMPQNVTAGGGYIRYIRSFSEPVLSESQVQEAVSQIQLGRLEPNLKTHRQHVRQLNRQLNSRAAASEERKCPRCGANLVLRKAKRGANAGKAFWGCSSFPKCRVVQDVT